MKKDVNEYFKTLECLFGKIIASDLSGRMLSFDEAICKSIQLIVKQSDSGGKLLFIGNGASAAISSHMAVDFWKNSDIRAISFNDSALLTCMGNDYGYEYVFQKPIEAFGDSGDILIAISSSGQSKNIIRAVESAQKMAIQIVTLSGFNKENPLRKLGNINFYVPASTYGFVEIMHHAICHCLVDMLKERNG